MLMTKYMDDVPSLVAQVSTPFVPIYCFGDKNWILMDGSCYFIKIQYNMAAPWEEAEAACVKMGAHLVSFHTSDELDFVVNAVSSLFMLSPTKRRLCHAKRERDAY